jgi:hypothetical protein
MDIGLIQISKMHSLLLIVLLSVSAQAHFRCDFESTCDDFLVDRFWGWTDGFHPILIDHDHTTHASNGHYLFYQGSTNTSVIEAREDSRPSPNQTLCFALWYFTRDIDVHFNIELQQGDDYRLARTLQTINVQNQTFTDWTQVRVVLPNERFKLAIRLNATNQTLLFDDLSIDECDEPQPPMPTLLFACDFESSCGDNFVSLSFYPYQWQVIQAGQPPARGSIPPQADATFRNGSGHYMWLDNAMKHAIGRVGYFSTLPMFDIDQTRSFCLNLEYFQYDFNGTTRLKVFAWPLNASDAIQLIWPSDPHQ